MTEVKAAAGADMPGELGAEMIGFVNELKSFRADIQKRLQAQEDRMTMLDRKTISRGRAPLSAEADAGAPHQKAFDAYIRHGDDDALRGLPLEQAQANLQAMIEAARARGTRVLLAGIEVPPNYGPDYADAFRAMYARLAQAKGVAFLPFLLEPIATDLSQFQSDTIHPTAEAQPALLDHVWRTLAPMLE